MSPLTVAVDLVAICVLAFVLYFPRHRRRELVVALLGINVGVLGISTALTSAQVSAGLGLGLLGVLSIIRLRSFELDQQEIAYYFVSLAMGVLGGIALAPVWLTPALIGAMLVAVWIGDHPRLYARYRTEQFNLDAAYTDESQLVSRLEQMLHARVHRVRVRSVDLVNDTTLVEVRYKRDTSPGDRDPAVGLAPNSQVGADPSRGA